MTRIFRAIAMVVFTVLAVPAWAQGTTWVQIEARPNEAQALERAGAYAAGLEDVNGFRLNTGWYAITLGPYPEDEARARLLALRAVGAIPPDSYLTDGEGYGARFFGLDTVAAAPAPAPVTEPLPLPEPGEESVTEARAGERGLTREDRQEVQIALRAAGFYNSVIDADFGPGTRRAMGAWQEANGFEATGVLTTRQRAELVNTYRAALATLGLEEVRNEDAGIAITLPLGLVALDRLEPPFAHYESAETDGPRVLLISQTGDRGTLAALYNVLETLEIMPLDGPRRLNRTEFTMSGTNDALTSHAYARLTGDSIKGYVKIWPAEDGYRGAQALAAMEASFQPIDGVLPDSVSSDQSIDLLSGLRIRKPERTASGFYVSSDGAVLTSADAIAGCGRIEIGGDVTATVAATDEDRGVALLRAETAQSPLAFARLAGTEPRLQSEIAVAGYSFGGVLTLPSVTFGTLADVRGLDGDESTYRLALMTEPGDTGGPVFDASGAVAGMLLATEEGARVLPGDVAFARDAEGLAAFLEGNGIAPLRAEAGEALAPEDLATLAADMTVLVTCWN